MRARSPKLAALVAGIALAAPMAAHAAPIAAGVDLFETDPTTQFAFSTVPIPAGFFDKGSAPFAGTVTFGGMPFNNINGTDTGDADTAVQRLTGTDPFGPMPAVSIQLMRLNLVSISPITVSVGGTSQLWDVRASVGAMPSMGTIVFHPNGAAGGTYDSDLQVLPLFVFTRLSDHATRLLDTSTLPASARAALTLQERGAPYRAGGCMPPALAVPGINDGFCPGETPNDKKILTYEESQAAAHGIRPVQPRLEHFKCYDATKPTRFGSQVVTLQDQFGSTRARVGLPAQLCNPVQKNAEPFRNKTAHLLCYAIRTVGGRYAQRTVPIRDQFGTATVRVQRPSTLCVPSVKQILPARGKPKALGPDEMVDHFQCYRVSTRRSAGATVTLHDEFHIERNVRVLLLEQLCAPVSKNGGAVADPVRHLACYRIKGPPARRGVRVTNQFGRLQLTAGSPRRLCVPAIKGEPEHQPPPFTQRPPLTQQQQPVQQPPTPTPTPPAFSGSGSFAHLTPLFGEVSAVEFTVSFNQETTQFDIVLSGGRQVLGGSNPSGMTCAPATTTGPQPDTYRCTGKLAANTTAQGTMQVEKASLSMGGQLYGYQSATRNGPFAITGP